MTDNGGAVPSGARLAAYEAVHAVSTRDAYANLVLPGLVTEHGLLGRDAAFATELAYGTLRHLGTLDLVLAAASGRPVERLDADVRDVLRLGAYQLLFTRVPSHAAVATGVDLALAVTRRPQAVRGLVNAVLRRVAEKDLDAWTAQLAPDAGADPVGHLSVVHSHPAWIVAAVRDALAAEGVADPVGETAAALAADNLRPEVHLVARPGRITREDLLEAVLARGGGREGPWSPYAVRMAAGDPASLAAVRDRRAGVQDEGSQLVALAAAAAPLAADALGAVPDRRWLDMCAGPGGKAALWGALAARRGAQVVAVERAAHRARLVRRTTAGLPVEVRTADATGIEEPGTYDRVLLDAPCSGLGALRRRPEARWRRTPSDVADLTALQDGLLRAAVRLCRPGGVVAYVTCSPHLAETRERVAALLAEAPGEVELLDGRRVVEGVSEGIPELADRACVQLWPHRHGTDAMFLALLRRT